MSRHSGHRGEPWADSPYQIAFAPGSRRQCRKCERVMVWMGQTVRRSGHWRHLPTRRAAGITESRLTFTRLVVDLGRRRVTWKGTTHQLPDDVTVFHIPVLT